jgi:hypothetical protein
LTSTLIAKRLLQPVNGELPPLVTPPKLVTLLGIMMFVMPGWEKDEVAMVVTGTPWIVLGIVTVPPGPVYPVIVIVKLAVIV